MWRNRGGQVRKRRGQGRQFGRNDQRNRDNRRRDEFRDNNLTGYDSNRQDNNKDSDRNFRQDSTEYDRNPERYARSGIEDRTERYVDDRNMYPDIHTASFDARDEYQDTALYRDQGIDRRNIVEDFRGYDDIDNRNDALYWEDRRPQELDDFRNRDQGLRTDDVYRNREAIDFHTDTLHRYDRNMLIQQDVRVTEQYHERQDDFRDRGIIHHDTTVRNQNDQRTRFSRNDNMGLGRIERHDWKDERISEKKPPFKSSHIKDSRLGNKGKSDSRSRDRSDSGKRHSSAKRSSLSSRRDQGNKVTAAKKSEVGSFKRNDSGTKGSQRSESSAKHEHKKPEQKDRKKSSTSMTHGNKSSAKDRNSQSQKTADSFKIAQNKHISDKKQNVSSSNKNRRDEKKQKSSSTITDSSSFKKPGDLQHQPRLRSNSGRKMDSDLSHFDDEDILSIMADDEGFEREMKTYSNAGGHSGSRTRESKERKPVVSRNSSRESHERTHHSRDEASHGKPQLGSDRRSHEKQQHGRDRDNKYDNNIKPAFDRHAKASATRSGMASQNVDKSLQVRSQTRIQNDERNRSYKFTNRFRPDVSQGRRHMNSRQGIGQTGRNNNNNMGGRSRFFVASKIKDSYLKRKTFQGTGNRRFGRRQDFKPFNANNQSYTAKQQIHGKNEVGITGEIQEGDRIRENRLSEFRNRDRDWQNDDDKKGNKSDRNFRDFPFSQYVSGNIAGNRFQRDRAKFNNKEKFSYGSFKSRGSASHRVKQKYFKGPFGQNRNNSRDFRGGQKNYGRQNKANNKQWDRRSVVDKNEFSDVVQVDVQVAEQHVDDQTLDPNQQQVIFIPNTDLQTGQPHMIDQYGQIVLNPEMNVQQGEEPVPIQYLPQQFHPDGVPPGEQVVFIPFVNNQMQPEYSEKLPLAYNENPKLSAQSTSAPEERKRQKSEISGTKVAAQKKKPLSQQARANLRKIIEIKRKQRLEKEIEKKLLRKLLRNPDVNKAVRENNEVKKKTVIKRISPPKSNKPSQGDKKLIRSDNNTGDLEDVSEDEAKYDNVSDLEDVSEYEDDEYGSRQGKRPVFRKPGQPRINNKNVAESSRDVVASTSGDIRRVVDHNARRQDKGNALQKNDQSTRLNPSVSKQKLKQGEKGRRSVYIDNIKDNTNSVTGQKRVSDNFKHENKPVKKRRSISPIEITVSNDRYSNATSRNSGQKHLDKDKYNSSKFDDRQRNSSEGSSNGKYDRTRNEKSYDYKKINRDTHQDGREKETHRYEDKVNRGSENRDKGDREEKKYRKDRNYHSSSDAEENYRKKELSKSLETEQSSSGKYDDYKDYRKGEEKDRSRNKKERNKTEDPKDSNEERRNKQDEKRGHGSNRQDGDPWRNENDRDNKRRDRSRERMRSERKRSLSRDRSLPQDQNMVRHSYGSNRNIQGNNFVSSINQSQFQMNQPLMQQSMQHQPFITAQSQSIPLHGQSVMQFSNSGNTVDHSLPPVQNAPMSIPPFPPPNLGVRPDMSLPPPAMNVVGTPTSMSTMVIQQQPNSVQFQQQPIQQMSMQQQPMQQQQQFQNMQPQFQQQQFQQIQSQPQIIQQQQQSNSANFQSHQPAYHNNLQSNQQMSLQQMQSGQFQQTQSGVTMMSINQNQMQNQQTGSVNQSPRGISRQGIQGIQTSGNQQQFVAATPQQAVRGVLGRIKSSGDGSKAVVRAQPVRIAANINQVSQSPTISRRQVNTKQSSFTPSGSFGSRYNDDDENEEEDDFLEMLCSKCDKVFLSHEVMRRHGRWHDMVESNTKNWRCDQCEQGFSSSSGHTEHMSVKHSRDSWNCSLCDMSFTNSSGLNRHVRHASHKDLKVKFVCSMCPASFMVLMHLVQHKKDNHQSNTGYSGLRKY